MSRALHRLASIALDSMSADRCAILVRDPRGRRLLPGAAASRVGRLDEMWERFRAMEPVEIAEDPARRVLWDAGKPVIIDDAQSSPIVPPAWRDAWGSKSLACAKLTVDGETLGLVAVEYVDEPHAFTEDESALLEAIADAAAVALRGARLVSELQRAVEVQRRLVECTAAIRAGLPLSEVLGLVADGFASLLKSSSAAIFLLAEGGETITRVAARGDTPVAPEISLDDLPPSDVAAVRSVWEAGSRKPVRIADMSEHPQWEGIVPAEVRAGMLVPLADGDALIGVVAVGRRQPPFSTEEAKVATAFADHAAVAVTQARLAEALSARLRLSEALLRLSGFIPRTSGFRSILSTLNTTVCADMGVRCERVAFLDEDMVRLLGVRGPNDEDLALIREWRHMKTREPIVVGAKAAVPIWIQGRAAGVLRVGIDRILEVPTREFLQSLADGVGEIAFKAKLRIVAQRRAQELAIAEDRETLGRELHNTVGQAIHELAMKAEEAFWEASDPDLRARIAGVRALAGSAASQLRETTLSMSVLQMRAGGLVGSLRALAAESEEHLGAPVVVRVPLTLPSMSARVERALLRFAHETLLSIGGGSRATGVVLTLSARDGNAILAIRDDGVGLDQRQITDWRSSVRFGLGSAEHVLRAAGGRLQVAPAVPRGLVIRAIVPLDDFEPALLP